MMVQVQHCCCVLIFIFIPSLAAENKAKTEKLIAGTYHRHPDDGRNQTNLNQFFVAIPYGGQYRNAVMGLQSLHISDNRFHLDVKFHRVVRGTPNNQSLSVQSGLQLSDPFLGGGVKISTIFKIKENRLILERNLKGVKVYEVMHFSKQGCRTTYYTSDDYGIDFLRRHGS